MVASNVLTAAVWAAIALVLVAGSGIEAHRHGIHQISIFQVAAVMSKLGLKLHDKAAERAFTATDFRKVTHSDFRALQVRAEEAKRQEQRLMAARASVHAVICNKLIKVGTEAVIGAIKRDKAFLQEHLMKFNKNFHFLNGRKCKDENF